MKIRRPRQMFVALLSGGFFGIFRQRIPREWRNYSRRPRRQHYTYYAELSAICLIAVILLSSCLPAIEPDLEPSDEAAETSPLTTARVSAQIDEGGRVIVTGHNDRQFFVDVEPSSVSIDEVETLLAAQTSCAVFVAEKAAQELDVPLTGVTATTSFDRESQKVQVYLDLPGANGEQIIELANHLRQRCPIYTTLSAAESVEFTSGEQFEAGSTGTAVVAATLFRAGGAEVTARDHTFVMDSVPPLDGPNVELNPLDMMLGGLAACSSFAYESQAPQAGAVVTVEGDFDPSGVRKLEGENPRIQDLRIITQVDAIDEIEADQAEGQIREQCYLYNILKGSVNIEISTELLP